MDEQTKKAVHSIFQAAERNRAACEKLAGNPEMIGPRVTLLALAIELYLKALLAASKMKYGGLHDHSDLFKRLPPKTREAVRARYDAEVTKPEVAVKIVEVAMKLPPGVNLELDFEKNLAKGSRAFVKWRYSYEGDLPSMPTGFEICEALRQELISALPGLPVIDTTGDRFILLTQAG